MRWLSRWFRSRTPLIPVAEFDAALARLPILDGLSANELARLRTIASLFLHTKRFTLAGGAEEHRGTQLAIALQASLLILNLDEQSYRSWREIVLYPNAFLRPRTDTDAAGVVHHRRDILSGESWRHTGPLVLSITDALASGQGNGNNVVLHEFAHKLDMLNGHADGFPPLHRGMDSRLWARDFNAAYADFCGHAGDGHSRINPYAATSPAEFFAVLTEVFFETPHVLNMEYPAIYRQLQQFYRQHPLARLESHEYA